MLPTPSLSRAFLLLAAGAIGGAAFAAAAEPFPVDLRVEWAEGSRGTAALREEIVHSALDALTERGCCRERGPGEQDALLLDVVLEELREETLYEDSLAEYADPGRPGQAQRLTAVFGVFVRWTLAAPGGGPPLAARRFRVERNRRPLIAGEDAAARARGECVEALGRELARAVCGVSRKKVAAALRGAPR